MKKIYHLVFLLVFVLFSCKTQKENIHKNTVVDANKLVTIIKTKDINAINKVVNQKNVNTLDSSGVSLLCRGIFTKDFHVVKALVEKGADVSLVNQTKNKTTPLMMCSSDVPMLTYLIDKGADIDAQDHNGDPVINWAAYMGNVKVVKLLLDKGARTDQKSIHSDNTMGVALKEWQDSIVNLLVQYNRGIYKVNPDFKEIITAVKNNDVAYVKGHINSQNCNAKDASGNSLLINAANNGCIKIVKILLKNKATIDEVNIGGHTALNKAVWSKKNEVAKYLINQGADVNRSNKRFELPPLVASVRSKNLEMGRVLLEKGANVNTINTIDKFTPIIWAVFNENIDFIKLLLKYHPDLSIKSKYDDRTIFDYAKDKKEIMELLHAYQNKAN